MITAPDIAASIEAQAKEIAAAADLYIRMPRLRRALAASLAQQLDDLSDNVVLFAKKHAEEQGPEEKNEVS